MGDLGRLGAIEKWWRGVVRHQGNVYYFALVLGTRTHTYSE
jgi:hypothetical protein